MSDPARVLIAQEARALATRLAMVKAFSLHEPMVAAAQISPSALSAIEVHLATSVGELRRRVEAFIEWLEHGSGRTLSAADAQRVFAVLRMRFNATLADYEIFAAVFTQRSEHDNGVWLAGLDVVATDALDLSGRYAAPPVVCYLDRGFGAAIRRARTRLPGGRGNPAAIIRIPRERMVGGAGIASSLVHEVGHQGAALLDLVPSIRPGLRGLVGKGGAERDTWQLWDRWISEIVADLWGIARLGISSTLGLIGTVTLPRAFVFRITAHDPHPAPWTRVLLSCAMGAALYPHGSWKQLAGVWESLYPRAGLPDKQRVVFERLLATMDAFVKLTVNHRPRRLQGASIAEALSDPQVHPARLSTTLRGGTRPTVEHLSTLRPTLALATISQARLMRLVTPVEEADVVGGLLRQWALERTLRNARDCGPRVTSVA